MPPTDQEMVQVARLFATGVWMPDYIDDIVWEDGEKITRREAMAVIGLVQYEMQRRSRYDRVAQRKARKLLKRFLTKEQLRQMRGVGYFYVRAASGTVYRIDPKMGWSSRVARHGKHYFETHRFCLHDFPAVNPEAPLSEQQEMPPADVALAHLLLLTTNEQEFLATANERVRETGLWNGDYLRRLRQNRAAWEESQA